ncbi:Desmethyl-deoxy-podophyllotoxin synthase [Linum perenne]
MDDQSFFSVFLFSAVCLLAATAWKLKKKSSNTKLISQDHDNYNNTLPPSPPWKLPVIGHMLHLLGSLPHRRLRDLAKSYGPHLMFLQLGETRNVVVSSAESAREVMKTHDLNFANRPVILAGTVMAFDSTDVAFAPYGAYWRQLKKICTVELLSSKRVQSFRHVREEEVSRFVDRILLSTSAGGVVDLSKETRRYTSTVIARSAFGEKCGEAEEFMRLLKDGMVLSGGFHVEDLFPSMTWLHVLFGARSRMEKVSRGFDRILSGIINEHKRRRRGHNDDVEERGDLVDILLKVQENGELEIPFTDDNVKAIILDVFTGGSDTTSSLIEWAMSEMLRNPRVLNKAQEEVRQHPHLFSESKNIVEEANIGELNYLKLVIKEALRLHPPVAMLVPRQNMEKCEIDGYTIPANTKITINAWAIGRNPKYWTQSLIQTLTIGVSILSLSHLVLEEGCALGSRLVGAVARIKKSKSKSTGQDRIAVCRSLSISLLHRFFHSSRLSSTDQSTIATSIIITMVQERFEVDIKDLPQTAHSEQMNAAYEVVLQCCCIFLFPSVTIMLCRKKVGHITDIPECGIK